MNHPEKVMDAVAEHYDVTYQEIRSDSRKIPLPLCRKIIVHLMPEYSSKQIAELINRSDAVVCHNRSQMNREAGRDNKISADINSIKAKLQDMNIKLNKSQIGSLWEVLEMFLSMKPESVTLELVCFLLEEIKEKSRKRFIGGKENIGLDEKQIRAFIIWHHHFGGLFEQKHPHGHMTLLDIIHQIKPIAYAHRINIQT